MSLKVFPNKEPPRFGATVVKWEYILSLKSVFCKTISIYVYCIMLFLETLLKFGLYL